MSIAIGNTNPELPSEIPDNISNARIGSKKTVGETASTEGPTASQLIGGSAPTPSLEPPTISPTLANLVPMANDLQSNPACPNIWVLINEVMILSERQDNELEHSSNTAVTSDANMQMANSMSAADQDKDAATEALVMGIVGATVSVGFAAISLGLSASSLSMNSTATDAYNEASPYSAKFNPQSNPLTMDQGFGQPIESTNLNTETETTENTIKLDGNTGTTTTNSDSEIDLDDESSEKTITFDDDGEGTPEKTTDLVDEKGTPESTIDLEDDEEVSEKTTDSNDAEDPAEKKPQIKEMTADEKAAAESYAHKQFEMSSNKISVRSTIAQSMDTIGGAAGGLFNSLGSSLQLDKQADGQYLTAVATNWQTLGSELQNYLSAIQQNEQGTASIIQSVLSAQSDQKNIPI